MAERVEDKRDTVKEDTERELLMIVKGLLEQVENVRVLPYDGVFHKGQQSLFVRRGDHTFTVSVEKQQVRLDG